jgi:hypothetical protein
VTTIVRYLWPKASVEVYGSSATLLCIPSSDLDLVVIGTRPALVCRLSFQRPPLAGAHPTESGNPFEMLVRELKKQPWLHMPSFQPIETARIPVIKLISCVEKVRTSYASVCCFSYGDMLLSGDLQLHLPVPAVISLSYSRSPPPPPPLPPPPLSAPTRSTPLTHRRSPRTSRSWT